MPHALADLYELLSIERGDPLAKVPFLELTEKTTERALAKWLATYRPLKRAANGRMDAMTQLRGGSQLVVPEQKEWSPFTEVPTDLFGQLEKLLRTGLGLLG